MVILSHGSRHSALSQRPSSSVVLRLLLYLCLSLALFPLSRTFPVSPCFAHVPLVRRAALPHYLYLRLLTPSLAPLRFRTCPCSLSPPSLARSPRSTLSAYPSTLLGAMFSERNSHMRKSDRDGEYFFDRDPEVGNVAE